MKMNAELERSYFTEKWQEIVHNGKGLELKMSTGGVPQDEGVKGDYWWSSSRSAFRSKT